MFSSLNIINLDYFSTSTLSRKKKLVFINFEIFVNFFYSFSFSDVFEPDWTCLNLFGVEYQYEKLARQPCSRPAGWPAGPASQTAGLLASQLAGKPAQAS